MITVHEQLQELEPLSVATATGEAILRVLLYYDIFQYPLSPAEILTFCGSTGYTQEEIEAELILLSEQGFVRCHEGYWYMQHQEQDVVERRLRMEERGAHMWKIARRFGRLMRMFPFVRGVFISGQLSRYIADEESDIDYFVVTDPGRLWIVRTLFVLFRRTVLLNNRKFFCTNYYVTTDNLYIREHNIYTACEIASLKPLWNRELFETLQDENAWITEFYPHFSLNRMELKEGVSERTSVVQKLLESLIPATIANRLDKRFMHTTRTFLQQKFPGRSQFTYEHSLRCTPRESRAHPNDQAKIVLKKYNEQLRFYGIPEDRATADD